MLLLCGVCAARRKASLECSPGEEPAEGSQLGRHGPALLPALPSHCPAAHTILLPALTLHLPPQIGVKSQLSGATVRLALFLGNKAGEALTQVGTGCRGCT